MEEEGKRWRVAIAALAVIVAGIGAWQAIAEPDLRSLHSDLTSLHSEVDSLQAQVAELKANPPGISADYTNVGLLESRQPTDHYTCAAFTSPGGTESYRRCAYLGAKTGLTSESSLLIEAPQRLKVMVYAKNNDFTKP
jgi:hypothetical protein